MSAIYADAADIPTSSPHPTGAATVINFNCVVPPFCTTAPSPTTPASTSPSSTSASDCYYSDPASSSVAAASASPSRLESRDFSLEQHQAEYRAHAYLANESIVATKLAADKFLQNLFKTRTEPDKDILRAASSASAARLQNPFAYNNSRSSGSSGSSSSSSGSSSYYSGSSGSSHPRSTSGSSSSSPNPIAPTTPAPRGTAILGGLPLGLTTRAAPISTEAETTQNPAFDLASWPFGTLTISPPAPAADDDKPLTEADFTGCIKLEDAINNTAPGAASRSTTILCGVLMTSTTTAAPDTKTPPRMAVPLAAAMPAAAVATPTPAQTPVAPESTGVAPAPEPASDVAIWPFATVAICPTAPTEAEFRALEEKLTSLGGRPFTIGRTANIHDPKLVASFEENAL